MTPQVENLQYRSNSRAFENIDKRNQACNDTFFEKKNLSDKSLTTFQASQELCIYNDINI